MLPSPLTWPSTFFLYFLLLSLACPFLLGVPCRHPLLHHGLMLTCSHCKSLQKRKTRNSIFSQLQLPNPERHSYSILYKGNYVVIWGYYPWSRLEGAFRCRGASQTSSHVYHIHTYGAGDQRLDLWCWKFQKSHGILLYAYCQLVLACQTSHGKNSYWYSGHSTRTYHLHGWAPRKMDNTNKKVTLLTKWIIGTNPSS